MTYFPHIHHELDAGATFLGDAKEGALEARPFHCWSHDMHELVGSMKDIEYRLASGVRQTPCTVRDCDWCKDKRRQMLRIIK